MAEYRLDELAQVSGVSVRNIRAYRERGLLDAPRRHGRTALYDDYHLSQLSTISQLLAKGFTSAHIAEFFTSMRKGADLADILGLQRAVLGPRSSEAPKDPGGRDGFEIDIRPDSEEARRLVSYGIAEIVAGKVKVIDRGTAEILTRTPDPLLHVRALLRFVQAGDGLVDSLAEAFVASLVELFHQWAGPSHPAGQVDAEQVQRLVHDHRVIGETVMAAKFDEATRRHMVASASEYTVGVLLARAWAPRYGT